MTLNSAASIKRDLSPRHEKRKDEIKKELDIRIGKSSKVYLLGAIEGMRIAILAMYPDVTTFFGQDKQATELTLTALALEELAHGE